MTSLFWSAVIVGVVWGGYEMLMVLLDPYRERFTDVDELAREER